MFLTESQGLVRSFVVPLGPVPRDSAIPSPFSREAASFEQSVASSNPTPRVIVSSVLGATFGVLALGFLGFYIYRRRSTLANSPADNTPLSLREALSLEPPSSSPRSRFSVSPVAEPVQMWPDSSSNTSSTLPRWPNFSISIIFTSFVKPSIPMSSIDYGVSTERSDRSEGGEISGARSDPERYPPPSAHTLSGPGLDG